MSQENVEIARAVINALDRGDIDAALKDAAPDFVFDFSRSVGLEAGVYKLDQMRTFFGRWVGEMWESSRFEADEFIEAGDLVMTPVTNLLRGRDGIEVQARGAWVWTFRDGSVARVTFYPERQDALEAAGLSE
jgi:ketosteroid isomerase-like protein